MCITRCMSERQQLTWEASVLEWDLADRLRKALRIGHIKPGAMAEYLGVNRNTVGNYINGRIAPDKRTVRLWALRCGVPFEWLSEGVVDLTTPDGPNGGQPAPAGASGAGGQNLKLLKAA